MSPPKFAHDHRDDDHCGKVEVALTGPTAAAPMAALPIRGTPAHDAITAKNSKMYSHHSIPAVAELVVELTM